MSSSSHASVRLLERIARGGAWISGLGLLGASWLIVVDLIARKLLGVSLGGADEIAGYVLAVARSHIRVDVLYTHLSSETRVALDFFALACLSVFVGVLTFHAWTVLSDSISFHSVSNTPLRIPQWIPQSLWFAGYAFFSLTVVVLGACALARVVSGRWQDVNGLIGIHSLDEEIEAEMKSSDLHVIPATAVSAESAIPSQPQR